MDLTYTNGRRVDQGVFSAYALDMSYGAEENDFELLIGTGEAALESGAVIYMEGTEYGGTVDGLKSTTHGDTITYFGRTWHGLLNSKIIQPNTGEDYLIVSGEANAVLASLLSRLGLSGLFVADEKDSGIIVSGYQFARYCKAYDGIRDMLKANGAKLRIAWMERSVYLSAEAVADYTDSPVDADIALLSVEQHRQKTNHLICLGKGDLSEREVIHLYANGFGSIGDVQHFVGLDEICDVYENANAEDLRADGIEKFKEIRNVDKAEMSITETEGLTYDIGDIVGATEHNSGAAVAASVVQKIVKINNGVVSINYKTEG